MKKLILLILIFVLSLIGYIYIYNNMQNSGSNSKKELVFWTLQLGTFSDYIQPIIDEFEASHSDIKIVWVDIPYSEGGKRTLASIMSDNPPDLINTTPDFSTLLAQKNTLYTFDKTNVAQYLPSIMQSLTYDGQNYYAIPFYATTAVTFYNKSLVEKMGVKILPETYEKMYELSKTALDKTGVYITMPTINENDTFLKILNKYDLMSADKINSKASVTLVNTYKNLYQKGLIPKESLTQTHRESLEKYMAGQIVFYNGGGNFLNIIKENAPDTFAQTNIIPQITGKNGQYDFSLMNLVIPKKAKNKELALEFAKLLTNEKNQMEFARLTNVLPVNKSTLEDKYFTVNNDNDLMTKTRIISANQLKKALPPIKFKDQKGLASVVNRIIAEILLDKIDTQSGLNEISKWMKRNE